VARSRPPAPAPVFSLSSDMWRRWRLNIACATEGPIPVGSGAGSLLAGAQLTGTAAAPLLEGYASLAGIPAQAATVPITVDAATITFRGEAPGDPWLISLPVRCCRRRLARLTSPGRSASCCASTLASASHG
jgi:hypothetical protein